MRATSTIVLAVVLGLAGTAWSGAKPTLEVVPAYPRVGEPATVTLKGAEGSNVRLQVTYRPGSQTEVTEQLGAFKTGTARWMPGSPGVTRLTALVAGQKKPLASVTVSTRFPSAPLAGITVMVVAALVLFGGVVLSMRAALRG